MDYSLLTTLSVTAALTIVGWFIAHRLSVGRDYERRRKEQRLEFLVSAYRRLAMGVYRGSLFQAMEEVQSAIADIYLYGSERHIQLVEAFVQKVGNEKHAEIDDLLVALRRDLRAELGLEAVERDKLWWLIRTA